MTDFIPEEMRLCSGSNCTPNAIESYSGSNCSPSSSDIENDFVIKTVSDYVKEKERKAEKVLGYNIDKRTIRNNWTLVNFLKSFLELCLSFVDHDINKNPLQIDPLTKNITSEKQVVRENRAELIR